METKCEQIKEESKRKQEERRKIMSDTKMLLKTKGEILTNIDKRKYQLLIEKEKKLEFIFIDQFYFRWLKISACQDRDESSNSYFNCVMFNHL